MGRTHWLDDMAAQTEAALRADAKVDARVVGPSPTRPAVRDEATRQASAQPDPLHAPDTNTSVAGEEDPGAALDTAAIGVADAGARRPAQALTHRP